MLTEKQIKELNNKFMHKRVVVETPEIRVAGVCNFIGYNPHLPEWGFQVTVGRMPVRHVEIHHIMLQVL